MSRRGAQPVTAGRRRVDLEGVDVDHLRQLHGDELRREASSRVAGIVVGRAAPTGALAEVDRTVGTAPELGVVGPVEVRDGGPADIGGPVVGQRDVGQVLGRVELRCGDGLAALRVREVRTLDIDRHLGVGARGRWPMTYWPALLVRAAYW